MVAAYVEWLQSEVIVSLPYVMVPVFDTTHMSTLAPASKVIVPLFIPMDGLSNLEPESMEMVPLGEFVETVTLL